MAIENIESLFIEEEQLPQPDLQTNILPGRVNMLQEIMMSETPLSELFFIEEEQIIDQPDPLFVGIDAVEIPDDFIAINREIEKAKSVEEIPILKAPEKLNLIDSIKNFMNMKDDIKLSREKDKIKSHIAYIISKENNISLSDAYGQTELYLDQAFERTTDRDVSQQIGETASLFFTMPLQFFAGKGTGLGRIAQLKLQNELTPELIRKKAEEAETFVSEFFPLPVSPLAQTVHNALGGVVEKITIPARFLDKEIFKNYPNAGYTIGFLTELATFAALQTGVKFSINNFPKTKNVIKKTIENKKIKSNEINSLLDEQIDTINKGIEDKRKVVKKKKEHNKVLRDLINNVERETKLNERSLKETILRKQEIDFDPLELKPGTKKVNVGRSSNDRIFIDSDLLRELRETKRYRPGVIAKAFKTPIIFFKENPALRHIYETVRDKNFEIFVQKKNELESLKRLLKKFPDKKHRENLGKYWLNLSESGAKIFSQTKDKIGKFPSKYIELMEELQPRFDDLLNKINKARDSVGKSPVDKVQNYLPVLQNKRFFDFLFNHKFDNTLFNPQGLLGVPDPIFQFVERGQLRSGIKLRYDPIDLYSKYLDRSLKYKNLLPIAQYVREMVSRTLKDPDTNKTFKLKDRNPALANELTSWMNNIIEIPNVSLTPFLEVTLTKMAANLTTSMLGFNTRTILIQPFALLVNAAMNPTYILEGITHTITKSKKIPFSESKELLTRSADVAISREYGSITDVGLSKFYSDLKRRSFGGIAMMDEFVARIAFATEYLRIMDAQKTGKMKPMSQKEIIRECDAHVISTHGSGALENLSPIQRNAIGKVVTLWQTYTINFFNTISKEFLGIKNPELNKFDALKRCFFLSMGIALTNTLFEDYVGIPSPFPAPLKQIEEGLKNGDTTTAVTLDTMIEILELFPLGSSLKFNSSPLGPIVQTMDDFFDIMQRDDFDKVLLERALNGDKMAMIELGNLIGKITGIPGTAQTAKYLRGKEKGRTNIEALLGVKEKDKKRKPLKPGELRKRLKKSLK